MKKFLIGFVCALSLFAFNVKAEEITDKEKVNVYVFTKAEAFREYKPALIFKSPRTPIDRQINKAVTISKEPIDCANGYQLIFTN